jgi:hypothetical protein
VYGGQALPNAKLLSSIMFDREIMLPKPWIADYNGVCLKYMNRLRDRAISIYPAIRRGPFFDGAKDRNKRDDQLSVRKR